MKPSHRRLILNTAKPDKNFINLIRNTNPSKKTLYPQITGDRSFKVFYKLTNGMYAEYDINKSTNDDYMIMGTVGVASMADTLGVKKNYDSATGTWVTSNPPSYYTTNVGATFTGTFTGHKFTFLAYCDYRGGLWRFVIDNDASNPVDVSVYNSSAKNYRFTVIEGLDSGEHTYTATFMGQDPAHPYATPRGWCCYNPGEDPKYETIQEHRLTPSLIFSALSNNGSKKEFAISCKIGETAYWMPDHGEGILTATTQTVTFDDIEITDWTAETTLQRNVDRIVIEQNCEAIHPDTEDHFANVISTHIITSEGVDVDVRIEWLMEVELPASGYVFMFPSPVTFATELITGNRKRYATIKVDDSNTNLPECERCSSFAFTNVGGANDRDDYAVALTINDPSNSLRSGADDKRSPLFFISHRSDNIQKLYPTVYVTTSVQNGDVFEFSGGYLIGLVYDANQAIGA